MNEMCLCISEPSYSFLCWTNKRTIDLDYNATKEKADGIKDIRLYLHEPDGGLDIHLISDLKGFDHRCDNNFFLKIYSLARLSK